MATTQTATNWPIKHGTQGAYTNRGCRCADCRNAHAKRAREYRRSVAILNSLGQDKPADRRAVLLALGEI